MREEGVANVQRNFKVKEAIETSIFNVHMELGKFEDGTYFIWVYFSNEDAEKVYITPLSVNKGTKFEACPKHITLGLANLDTTDEASLQAMVTGDFHIALKKWSYRTNSSTYLFDDVFEYHLDEIGARSNFAPAGRWHISL